MCSYRLTIGCNSSLASLTRPFLIFVCRFRTRLILSLTAVMASSWLTTSATAITIIPVFNAGASVNPAIDPGAAGLQALMAHADAFYTDVFEDVGANTTLTINFWYEDLDPLSTTFLGVHNLVSEGGVPNRETEANIRLDNDRNWFIDSTPANNSEFNMGQTLWRDISVSERSDYFNFGSNIPDTFEVGYRGNAVPGGAADGLLDLLSTVIHEVGHALGMSASNSATQAETADGDYDFNPDFVFGRTLAAESVGSSIGHIQDVYALMCSGCGASSVRRLPSHTDLFSMASGHQYALLDVPRREWYAGSSDWNDSGNWSGDTIPGSLDDTFVRDNGSGGTITAGLSNAGFTADLFVGEAANVDTNDHRLRVVGTATVDGLDSDIIINPSGELDADSVVIQNEAEVFMTGGLLDAGQVTINTGTQLRASGAATVNVQNLLDNEGTIIAGGGGTFLFESSGGAVWDLDGFSTGDGIVQAINGDIDFASGSLTDAFNGDMDIGDGASARTLTIAASWTLSLGAIVDMDGGPSAASRAALTGGTIEAAAGTINANQGVNHINARVTLTGSTLNAEDGATLELNNSTSISGGTFQTTGTGQIELNGFTTYAGGTVGLASRVEQNGNAQVTVNTVVSGNGTWDMDGQIGGGTVWDINADLTMDVDSIETDADHRFNGTMNINGSGSTLTVNTATPWTMAGTANFDTNTTLTLPSIVGQDFTMSGTANVDGGTRWDAKVTITGTVNTVDAASTLSLGGDINGLPPITHRIEGGVVNGPGELRSYSDNQLHGFGTINANIEFVGDAKLLADDGTLDINGTFVAMEGTIGTADSDGILDVANAWNTSIATALSLNGGEVTGAPITNGGLTTGFGEISAFISNENEINADGGTLVLSFANVELDGVGESGVLNVADGDMRVTNTTNFFFNGIVKIGTGRTYTSDIGGLIIATGGLMDMTGGTYVAPSFAVDAGTLNVNAGNPSRISSADIDFLPDATSNIDDDLRLIGNARIHDGASFAGGGRLVVTAGSQLNLLNGADVGVTVRNEGRTEVGASTGIARVATFSQSAGATYEAEIDGLTLGTQYDQLRVTNTASLAGTLDVLINANGGTYADPAAPGTVDEFVLIVADSLSGSFDTVVYDGGVLVPTFGPNGNGSFTTHEGLGLFRIVDYDTGTEMRLLNYKALPGDANADGVVDGNDFIIWNENKFTAGTDWLTGDFNGDGFTDGSDFIIWNANKFTSVPLESLALLVPEPHSVLLLWGGLVLLGVCRARP